MKKRPLNRYVIGVIVVLIIVNIISWFIGGEERAQMVSHVSIGFLLGMLAMYIAVHMYKWK